MAIGIHLEDKKVPLLDSIQPARQRARTRQLKRVFHWRQYIGLKEGSLTGATMPGACLLALPSSFQTCLIGYGVKMKPVYEG